MSRPKPPKIPCSTPASMESARQLTRTGHIWQALRAVAEPSPSARKNSSLPISGQIASRHHHGLLTR